MSLRSTRPEKERRFFHRIGAMSDHDPVDVGSGQHLVGALGKLGPYGVVHVLAADVRDLLAVEPGKLLMPGAPLMRASIDSEPAL